MPAYRCTQRCTVYRVYTVQAESWEAAKAQLEAATSVLEDSATLTNLGADVTPPVVVFVGDEAEFGQTYYERKD